MTVSKIEHFNSRDMFHYTLPAILGMDISDVVASYAEVLRCVVLKVTALHNRNPTKKKAVINLDVDPVVVYFLSLHTIGHMVKDMLTATGSTLSINVNSQKGATHIEGGWLVYLPALYTLERVLGKSLLFAPALTTIVEGIESTGVKYDVVALPLMDEDAAEDRLELYMEKYAPNEDNHSTHMPITWTFARDCCPFVPATKTPGGLVTLSVNVSLAQQDDSTDLIDIRLESKVNFVPLTTDGSKHVIPSGTVNSSMSTVTYPRIDFVEAARSIQWLNESQDVYTFGASPTKSTILIQRV